jgi:hypothetical protein
MQNDVSRAVLLFLGFSTASSPHADRDALLREFGVEHAAELERGVASVLDDLFRIQIDWSAHSLASAGEFATKQIRAGHPELSEEALRALDWKFTFDWR